MPILHIRALPQNEPHKIQSALKETCIAISEVYKCDPKHVWATWEEILPGMYIEGNQSANEQPLETHPPIGQLLCFEGKDPETIETLLLKTAQTLSSALGLSENIFISYQEVKSGEVVSGNSIVRKK